MLDPNLAEKVREALRSAPPEVVAVCLHGSRARGTASPRSDLDLGILLRDDPRPALASAERKIEDDVERAVRIPVQAVGPEHRLPGPHHRVLRDGIVLLERDRSARIRFEVRARNGHFDLAPIKRLYRRVSA